LSHEWNTDETESGLRPEPNPIYFESFVVFVVPLWPFDKRGTTKVAKDTKTIKRNNYPQISQISTDEFHPVVHLICENLRNLWINPLVNKRHVVQELRFGADGLLRTARKFEPFVLRIRAQVRKIRV
jgi:hypothetical protein